MLCKRQKYFYFCFHFILANSSLYLARNTPYSISFDSERKALSLLTRKLRPNIPFLQETKSTKEAEKKAKDEQKEKNRHILTEFFNLKLCKYNSQRR